MIKELTTFRKPGDQASPPQGFADLVGAPAWRALPATVRRRFAGPLPVHAAAVWTGVVVTARITRTGWWLAQFARLIGAPLPLSVTAGLPATVVVSRRRGSHDQHWTRIYARPGAAPQVIHSVKRMAGATGIEEHIGAGLVMVLRLSCLPTGLQFVSDHFYWRAGLVKLKLPAWLTGCVTVSHVDTGGGEFNFELQVSHPWLGEVLYQIAAFADLRLPAAAAPGMDTNRPAPLRADPPPPAAAVPMPQREVA